jgi:hypothetical protein
MKNKKNIYILLPIVLFVWSAVLYQVFSFSNNDEVISTNNPEFIIKPLKVKERQSFVINVNYRDPFLGKMYAPQTVSKIKTEKSTIKKTPKVQETLVWPVILYKGMISDTKDKTKIFMIIIDGQNHYMKIGDTENEVYLKSGDKESVYVKYKGNLNLIMIQD